MTELSAECVDKYYQMDPETEVILRGSELKEGMQVLVESPLFRVDPNEEAPSLHRINKSHTVNHWAIVTDPEVKRGLFKSNEILDFLAEYADGIYRQRTYNASIAWIVKKDSIPATEKKTRDEKLKYITESFREVYSTDNESMSSEEMDEHAKAYAEDLMKFLGE